MKIRLDPRGVAYLTVMLDEWPDLTACIDRPDHGWTQVHQAMLSHSSQFVVDVLASLTVCSEVDMSELWRLDPAHLETFLAALRAWYRAH